MIDTLVLLILVGLEMIVTVVVLILVVLGFLCLTYHFTQLPQDFNTAVEAVSNLSNITSGILRK